MGILKKPGTLTIAVWSSILLHGVSFLGFDLAFPNKRESFPKSEPRTVTLISIRTAPEAIVPLEQVLPVSNTPPQTMEEIVPDESVSIKDEPSLVSPEEILVPNLITSNIESDNSGSDVDHPINQELSIVEDVGKKIPEIKEPVPVESIVPVYPFRARKKGLEGVVSLDITVSDKGVPVLCQITGSSGYKDLDDAAEKTVMASLFYPGTVDGEEVKSTLHIRIKFQLNNS